MGFGVWGMGFGVWSLGFGVWGLDFRVLGFGLVPGQVRLRPDIVQEVERRVQLSSFL